MQTPNEWLVTPPKGMSTLDALTLACKGHRNEAQVLYYFLYAAYYAAKDQGIDKETAEFVTIADKTQDKILEGIEKYAKVKLSKKTYIAHRDKLHEYEFVIVDGRRHVHQVYWKKVQNAIDNPPMADAPKLRGKHAPKPKEDNAEGQKVKTTKSPVKTTNCAQIEAELSNCSFEDLTKRVVVLTGEFVTLSREFEILTKRFVNLQIEKSHEEARRAELEGKIDALYNLYNLSNNFNINSLTSESAAIAPQKEESKEENNVIELSSRKTSQPSQRKSNRTKKTVASMQLALPDLDAPPTLEAILQAGDYIRGYALPEKNMKACREGAMALLQQKRPLRDIVKVLVYMSPRDEIRAEFGMKFKDEGYLNGPKKYNDADLSNIFDKMNRKLEAIAELEKQQNKPAQETPAHHVMPTATEPLNETQEERTARKLQEHKERWMRQNPVVFWTTTGKMDMIVNPQNYPLEDLRTWRDMPVEDAVNKYGMNWRKYGNIPSRRNNLLSRIAVLTSQTVSA